jgi:hypothetical protein
MCKCRGPPSVFEHIEYLKTKKSEDVHNKVLSVIKEVDVEETAKSHDILLTDHHQKEHNILFTTDKTDKRGYN